MTTTDAAVRAERRRMVAIVRALREVERLAGVAKLRAKDDAGFALRIARAAVLDEALRAMRKRRKP